MDRFLSVNSEDILSLVNKSKNSNTTKATSKWMRVLKPSSALSGKVRPISNRSGQSFAKFLC